MSTIQIQPGNSSSPPTPPPPRPDANDFYDPGRWESAYREMHDVPALLIQLQDDLSRSRRREAFWISLVFHLLLVIAVINADSLGKYLSRYLPKGVLLVQAVPNQRQNETTFLELPPDAEKLTKKPKTNILSDKDRIAMSRHPRLDPKELKHILDSAKPGAPGPSGPPLKQPPQPAQPPQQAMAQNAPPQQSAPRRPPAQADQMAKLTTPQTTGTKPSFNIPAVSPGRAIEQAARAALANPGGYGGDNGDNGLGLGNPGAKLGQLDVLSDTQGVDFGPYLSRVLHDVRQNWYNLIPEVARAPIMKKGKVSIEFAIMKDGTVAGMRLEQGGSSGDTALDRAAWGGITASNPFPPLPQEFKGEYLALRFHFYYNPDRNDLQ